MSLMMKATIMSESRKHPLPPSREGRSSLTVWLRRDVVKRLRHTAVETERSIQDIVEDAIIRDLDRIQGASA